jgi:hypothetical protein
MKHRLAIPHPDYETAKRYASSQGYMSPPMFADKSGLWICETGLNYLAFKLVAGKATSITKTKQERP